MRASSTPAATTLKNVTAKIPLGVFTCLTGVSGSGKSTLLIDTLYKAVARKLNNASEGPAPHDRIEGLGAHRQDRSTSTSPPIGRTPRSNPATYTGAPSRRSANGSRGPAGVQGARLLMSGWRFSFNVKGGRCEACHGDGVIKIEMHFLLDVYVTCDVCAGKRYNRETLEVLFKGKSIADVLDMTVEEALDFFKAVPRVRESRWRCSIASASTTSMWASRRPRCRAVRPSASSSPRSYRNAPPAAPSTSSTSRPPGCTSTT